MHDKVPLSPSNKCARSSLEAFIADPRFNRFIMFLIIANALTLGMATSDRIMGQIGGAIELFDQIALGIFTLEILAKLYVQRREFWKNGWNIFDFVIIAISLAPQTGAFSVLRALRILRALRLVSSVPQMRAVVQALITAIPGMISVVSLISLIFYVGAVLTTNLYGHTYPDWFGDIGKSMYTLFQVMTLESWSMGIVRPVMEQHPFAWVFFIPFILTTTFAVLNLFIGILVDAMQTQHQVEEAALHPGEHNRELDHKLDSILTELAALKQQINDQNTAKS